MGRMQIWRRLWLAYVWATITISVAAIIAGFLAPVRVGNIVVSVRLAGLVIVTVGFPPFIILGILGIKMRLFSHSQTSTIARWINVIVFALIIGFSITLCIGTILQSASDVADHPQDVGALAIAWAFAVPAILAAGKNIAVGLFLAIGGAMGKDLYEGVKGADDTTTDEKDSGQNKSQ